MHSRFLSKLTALRLAVILIATFVSFGTLQQIAFAMSSACPSASALCNGQPKPGRPSSSGGSPVGRSTLTGMPGLARPYVSDPFHHYFYAGGQQIFNAEGAVGNFEQEVPSLGGGAFHSLAELAVVSANQQQAVEVGWSVDPLTFHDGRPHLFVFYWLNGTPEGYDPSVFVHLANTPQPGQRVAVDSKMHGYGIEFFQGNWWIWYGTQWIGYFPGTLWNNHFTQAGLTEWFGEVAEPQAEPFPCSTQMGNGLFGQSNGSAAVSNMFLIVNGQGVRANAHPYQPTPHYYNVSHFTGNSFTYGGPGDTNSKDCPCEYCFVTTRSMATQGTLASDKRPVV